KAMRLRSKLPCVTMRLCESNHKISCFKTSAALWSATLSIEVQVTGITNPLAIESEQTPEVTATAEAKEEKLRAIMTGFGSVVVVFSVGVDSTYVAYIAHAELGAHALCITGDSASVPQYQRAESDRLAEQFGFRREVVSTKELDDPQYQANAPNRCYFCKS